VELAAQQQRARGAALDEAGFVMPNAGALA